MCHVVLESTIFTNQSSQAWVSNNMYLTKGIDAIATITELRSNTSELVEYAKEIERGILIQKNNQPYAVLISWELYDRLLASETDEKPKRRKGKK